MVTHPFLAASAALAACGLDGRGAAALVTSLEGETAFLDPKEGELNAGDLAAVVVLTPKVNPEDDEIEYVFIEEPDDIFNPFEMPFNDYLPTGILIIPESDAYANQGCASTTCN